MKSFAFLCCCACIFHLCAVEQSYAQRGGEREPRRGEVDELIREAIDNNTADPQVTRLAEERLRTLISRLRTLRAGIAAAHLEHFVNGVGTDIHYPENHGIAKQFRNYDGADFSHDEAHTHAMIRIRQYFESELRSGKRTFPAEIPLSSLGFTATGPQRLQGPNVYQEGSVFSVPVYPPVAVNMSAGFGDMQGPHEAIIRNARVVEQTRTDGSVRLQTSFRIEYRWVDQYTFNNDANMSDYDAAAHYLEFVARTAKKFETAVAASENVTEVLILSPSEAANAAPAPSTSPTPPSSGQVGTPSNGIGTPETNQPTNSDSIASGKTKLPPISIEHPPGWGVGK